MNNILSFTRGFFLKISETEANKNGNELLKHPVRILLQTTARPRGTRDHEQVLYLRTWIISFDLAQ